MKQPKQAGLVTYLSRRPGNVVCQIREEEPDALDSFTGAWLDGCFSQGPAFEEVADIGEAYLPRGVRGPPYGKGKGPRPYWLRLIGFGEDGNGNVD